MRIIGIPTAINFNERPIVVSENHFGVTQAVSEQANFSQPQVFFQSFNLI